MSDGETVLNRKLGMRRVGRSPLPDIELIGEYFGHRLEDKLRPIMGTIVGALIMDCEITKLSTVIEEIPVPAMLAIIDVDSSENSAMANLSTELVYHIVDMRMGGDANSAPIPTTRSFTAIDVALCMDVFQSILESFKLAIEEYTGVPLKEKMRVSGHKQDINTVRIAPKSADVLLLRVSLDVGEAARSGDFDLIVPLSLLDLFRASTKMVETEVTVSPTDLWRQQMRQSIADAPLPLQAILHTQKMAVSEVQAMAVGDVIALPRDCLGNVGVVMDMGTEYQSTLALSRLGGYDDHKVVKLNDELIPEALASLQKVLKS